MLRGTTDDETATTVQVEAAIFAEEQGLRYVTDSEPGYSRKRAGKGFVYLDFQSKKISCEKTLSRIKSLVIPPAWKNVWICRFGNGHLQVTGRDARTRKQYRYHPEWYEQRNQNKFGKMLLFGKALPQIRKQVDRDLGLRGMPKEKVLATILGVMEETRVRVGNDIYAKENKSYGLTTIRNKHAKVKGASVRFQFRAKSGVMQDVSLTDARLSRVVRNCQELPGEELFCYVDKQGDVHDIGSADVNEYIRRIADEDITAKDFRTWGGSIKALQLLLDAGPLEDDTQKVRKSRELEVIKNVASYLNNTVAVCRKYYVTPAVFEADRAGRLEKMNKKLKGVRGSAYSRCEQLLLKILES